MENSPIKNFYQNKTLFITGGTGFIGKVLVEKVLRSTNVSKIYLLIRPKKGMSPEERLDKILSSRMFHNLRSTQPRQFNKITAIPGDITAPNLGLSPYDLLRLTLEVEIVFHSAATVRFDEVLSQALAMNVSSVQQLLGLARRMKQLLAVVHVSTAFANCDRKHIEEKVYPPPEPPRSMIDMLYSIPSDSLDDSGFNTKILESRPNTYTFTKALAESLIVEQFSDLPITIVRPSIVVSAWKEPLPGWVDNLNGPTGLFLLAGKGVLRTARIHGNLLVDTVPVDTCVNLLIAAAWNIYKNANQELEIFNHISGNASPISWGEVYGMALSSLKRNPLEGMIWYPAGSFKRTWWVNRMFEIILHQVPAALVDVVFVLRGKTPVATSLCQKMHKGIRSLEYFTTHEWSWSNDNVSKLWGKLSQDDKDEFNFNLEEISWSVIIESYVKGIREYVLHCSPSTLPACQQRMATLHWIHLSFQCILVLILWLMVYFIFLPLF